MAYKQTQSHWFALYCHALCHLPGDRTTVRQDIWIFSNKENCLALQKRYDKTVHFLVSIIITEDVTMKCYVEVIYDKTQMDGKTY